MVSVSVPNCWGLPTRDVPGSRQAIGAVFQDPMSALTPVYTVGDQIAEAISSRGLEGTLVGVRWNCFDLVGISQPQAAFRTAFPHELSGGERQRGDRHRDRQRSRPVDL